MPIYVLTSKGDVRGLKVIYEDVYGIWGEVDDNGNMIEKNMGVKGMPMCPICKEPTYNEEICPFCKEPLEYE